MHVFSTKASATFTIAFVICVQQSFGMLGYLKILKVTYKQTGTRCKGLEIKLQPISRYESLFSASCEKLMRPVTGGFVNLDVSAKTANMQNYRHLASLKNLEPCKIMTDRARFPVMNYFVDRAMELYPKEFHLCPYTEVKAYNLSLSFMQNPSTADLAAFEKINFKLPNAVYRLVGAGWDGSGDMFNMTGWIESKYRKRLTQDLADM